MKGFFTVMLALYLPLLAATQTTWIQQDANYPVALQSFDVETVNANVAWTVGMTGDYTPLQWNVGFDGHYFSRTTDGTNWNSGTFPSTGAGWTVNVCALSADLAWIAFQDFGNGSHVFKTINGGVSWEDENIPVNTWIDFVHFWGNGAGLTMGDPDSLGFQIATTGNGGNIWTRVNPAGIPAALPGEFSINDMYTVVGNKVWYATNYGRVYYSPNKGYTWQLYDSGMNAIPDGLTCGESGHCLLVFGDYSDTVSENLKFHLRHSADGGTTWEDATPADNGWSIWGIQYVPGGNGKVIGVFRRNNKTGPYETRISNDNGLSWQAIDTGTPLLRLDFVNPTAGWATEYKTSENPTHIYKYTGNPLVGLFSPNALAAEVSVSPNPATEMLHVEARGLPSGDYRLLLNDGHGRLLRTVSLKTTADIFQNIDLRGLPNGVYTLTVTGAEGSVAKRVVKG